MTDDLENKLLEFEADYDAKIWSSEIVLADWTKKKVKLACLYDHYMVSQGDTYEEAIKELHEMVTSTILANFELKQGPLQGIAPPPQKILNIPAEFVFNVKIHLTF